MKIFIKNIWAMAITLLSLMHVQSSIGCPTCIGRLELQSPAFFSEELYEFSPEDDIKDPGHEKKHAQKTEQNQLEHGNGEEQ